LFDLQPIKSILTSLLIGALFLFVSCNNTDLPTTDFSFQPFISMATDSICSEIKNELFLIDNELVFWTWEGYCFDAGYSSELYLGASVELLCYTRDSIAGPQSSCEPIYEDLFAVIFQHQDEPNLGLGAGHSVQEIQF